MMPNTYAWIGTTLLGLAGIAAATVAVCLGKIDASTYVAIVGPVLGIGLGAGVHAQGVQSGTPTVVTPVSVTPQPPQAGV